MAVDTREKRFSMMNMGWLPSVNLFEADGTVDADDRAHQLQLYSGIALGAVTIQVSCILVDITGNLLPSLSLISWAWFDQTDPNLFAAPTDQGETETTDASAEIVVPLPNSALTAGQNGVMVLRSDDGVSLGAYEMTTEAP